MMNRRASCRLLVVALLCLLAGSAHAADNEAEARAQMGAEAKKNVHAITGENTANSQSLDQTIDNNFGGSSTNPSATPAAVLSTNSNSNSSSNSSSSGDTDTTTSMDNTGHVNDLNNTLKNNWYTAFQSMAAQLTAGMVYQVFAVGALFDAKDQLETQTLFQELSAAAHRDYQTDATMCTIGTNVRSLTASEAVARVNTRALDLAMAKREMLSGDASPAQGVSSELSQRWAQFLKIYCDPYDADHNLAAVCLPATGRDPSRINRDMNYTRTVEGAYTLNADFTNATDSADKEDVLALSRNLFAFRTFDRISPEFMGEDVSHDIYQDVRSVEAMRSVARNSFAHIVGMRASGTPAANNVAPFMRAVIAQMGVPAAEIDQFLGASPSYFAQMEVLTHKIYEQPEFYANLYTTPANVGRIGVSIQALRLMQDRDRYEAALRREMLVSLLLEVQIDRRQEITTGDYLRSAIGGLMNHLWQAAPGLAATIPPLP